MDQYELKLWDTWINSVSIQVKLAGQLIGYLFLANGAALIGLFNYLAQESDLNNWKCSACTFVVGLVLAIIASAVAYICQMQISKDCKKKMEYVSLRREYEELNKNYEELKKKHEELKSSKPCECGVWVAGVFVCLSALCFMVGFMILLLNN